MQTDVGSPAHRVVRGAVHSYPDLETPEPAIGFVADLVALAVLLACALVLHRDGLFGGPAFYERDTQLFYYPLTDWVGQQLKAHGYPLWLPAIFTGYPIEADGELGLLYLPQVALLAWLPTAVAIVWLRVFHVFLAGASMYLFLRTLRLMPFASLGGALVFAFGSFLVAQLHHENVVRSAAWLPLVLVCVERALRQATQRRQLAWLALGALAFAQAALGLHVQPVLMLAVAVAGWALFRVALGPRSWRSPFASPAHAGRAPLTTLLLAAAGVVLGGLAIAAAQWLPLAEWALSSFRRGGVGYEFASAFELAPIDLTTLVLPYFFRLPDGATWWSYWQQWETELYVGIPTLALALVGVVFSRRREVAYFLVLGLACLWIAMAAYAPLFNLHQLLWSVPGFSFLRAPGRFTYLVVFACAGLAALGLEALGERRLWAGRRPAIALLGAVPPAALLVALLAAFPAWRGWLLADPDRGRAFVDSTYLATRLQFPIEPAVAYAGMVASLDPTTPKTAWSLALLALTALGFLAWLGLGAGRGGIGQGLFVGLIAVDLLVFAADFHPRAPLATLVLPAPVGVPGDARVLLDDAAAQPDLEPNQLVAAGLAIADGYSSLPSERHVELFSQTQQQPTLIDLWGAHAVLQASHPPDAAQAGGVRFRGRHPLAAVTGAAEPVVFDVPPDVGPTTSIRLVGTLDYAYDVAQDTRVADLVVTDRDGMTTTLPIRVGVELAERAIDRRSLAPLLAHHKPPGPTALDFDEVTPAGEAYRAHLYLAQLDLPGPPRAVATLAIRPEHPKATVEVHGLGLVLADGGAVSSLTLADRRGFRLVADDGQHRVLEASALPRAYVVDRANAFSPAAFPNETPVQAVSDDRFKPRLNVLIEGDRSLDAGSGSGTVAPRAAAVEDLGPDAVRVTADAAGPSYLVLSDAYHRGWAAWVDGRSAPVYVADAVFRAVPLEAGHHVVELRFQPLSLVVGAVVSVVALATVVGIAGWGFSGRAG
jgi:Bacterial membrane protein YfhO